MPLRLLGIAVGGVLALVAAVIMLRGPGVYGGPRYV